MKPESALIYQREHGFHTPEDDLKALLKRHAVLLESGDFSNQFVDLVHGVMDHPDQDPHRLWPSSQGGLVLAVLPLKHDLWAIHFMEQGIPPEAQKLLDVLTQRETEVVYWVSQGKDNGSIADILNIRKNTVRKHLENVFLKLHCENRTMVASLYHEVLSQH
jgi:DNA-binding CsgD family transcriptional regulator